MVKRILSYIDLSNLLKKYGCKILITEEEYNRNIINKLCKVIIESRCGHTTIDASLNGFFEYKKYVYCEECVQSNIFLERECVACHRLFTIENDYQYFCNKKCSYIKELSEVTKEKIRNTLLNKNKNGNKIKIIKVKKEKILYEELKKFAETNGCKLLTSEEEYINIKGTKKVKILSNCGHITENILPCSFKKRSTGVKCKKCVIDRMKYESSINSKDDANIAKVFQIENECYTKIVSLVSEYFYIEKTNEGCLADIIIKPKSISNDLWLPIQLKSTSVKKRSYEFHVNNLYRDMLVICYCSVDEKMWCIDGNFLTGITKLSIGFNESKCDIYETDRGELCDKLLLHYNTHKIFTKKDINIPITIAQQKECIFKELREGKLSDIIKFKYTEMQCQCYDFIVIGDKEYKVQEKARDKYDKGNYACFRIVKHNGRNKFTAYNKGDNDFYWFHLPDKQTFYVIPEDVLLEKGYISDENKKGKENISLCYEHDKDIKTHWAYNYKFNYNDLNQEKLLNLFGIKNTKNNLSKKYKDLII